MSDERTDARAEGRVAAPVGARGVFDFQAENAPAGQLHVVALRGREAVSTPFSFEIRVRGADVQAASLERELLETRAHLILHPAESDGHGRTIHGVVRRVQTESAAGSGGVLHAKVWLAPRFWLLGKNRNSRIFQDVTVADIVTRVLGESLVACRFDLFRPRRPRNYCVQYQESDRAFVERLLVEEGMYYFFEHPEGDSGEETMVITDDARLASPIAGDPALHFRDSGGMVELDGDVRRFEKTHRVRPRKALLREMDWTRPLLDLSAAAEVGAEGRIRAVPGGDVRPPDPPGAPLPRALSDTPSLRVYDHTGELADASTGEAFARQHLEQHRAQTVISFGESRCRRLVPGRWIELSGAPAEGHDDKYLVLAIEHEGAIPETGSGEEVYRNRFECAPADVAYRPPRPRRKLQQVIETATVVGPPGHEIYTDPHGRIKVQMHWDRQGRKNEHSSCWIRVMQAWAGSGWGFQFIPRVGMEVVVGFVGGDTDRPMVLGSVYNAENAVPFQLPRDKTKSGIRTRTHKGSGGSNEVSFEDRAGYERLYLHGQKDIETEAENNHTARVRAHMTEQVGKNRYSVVGGNLVEAISGDVVLAIGGEERRTIEGRRVEEVRGSVDEETGGARRSRVQGDVDGEIRGEHRHSTRGETRLEAGADVLVRVHGSLAEVVGESGAPRSRTLHVEGVAETSSTGEAILRSDEAVTLQCGDSYIRIAPGTIEICSGNIVLRGEDSKVTLGGGDVKLVAKGLVGAKSDDKVALFSSGAHLTLTSDAKLDGSAVKLKAPGSPFSDEDEGSAEVTTIELVDRDGNPLANQRYRLYLEDGSERSGALDGEGKATLRFTGSADIEFPDLAEVESA